MQRRNAIICAATGVLWCQLRAIGAFQCRVSLPPWHSGAIKLLAKCTMKPIILGLFLLLGTAAAHEQKPAAIASTHVAVIDAMGMPVKATSDAQLGHIGAATTPAAASNARAHAAVNARAPSAASAATPAHGRSQRHTLWLKSIQENAP